MVRGRLRAPESSVYLARADTAAASTSKAAQDDPDTVRAVLNACARRLDGKPPPRPPPAASGAVFANAFGYEVGRRAEAPQGVLSDARRWQGDRGNRRWRDSLGLRGISQSQHRFDQGSSEATDATRTERGIHAAENGETAGQSLFRWVGMGGLYSRAASWISWPRVAGVGSCAARMLTGQADFWHLARARDVAGSNEGGVKEFSAPSADRDS